MASIAVDVVCFWLVWWLLPNFCMIKHIATRPGLAWHNYLCRKSTWLNVYFCKYVNTNFMCHPKPTISCINNFRINLPNLLVIIPICLSYQPSSSLPHHPIITLLFTIPNVSRTPLQHPSPMQLSEDKTCWRININKRMMVAHLHPIRVTSDIATMILLAHLHPNVVNHHIINIIHIKGF